MVPVLIPSAVKENVIGPIKSSRHAKLHDVFGQHRRLPFVAPQQVAVQMIKKEKEGEHQKQPVTPANEKLLGCFGIAHGSAAGPFQARRSLIADKISAITSAFGFAPRLPLPCRRTLTLPASMSRPPMTSMVWTFAFSASAILALIGSVPKSASQRTKFARSSLTMALA